MVSVKLTRELYDMLMREVKARNTTKSMLVRTALEWYLTFKPDDRGGQKVIATRKIRVYL